MGQLSITNWFPETPLDKQAVIEQLHRLLAHSLFRNSRRCSSLLQYTVEYSLAGDASSLKERTIGVEVFNRSVDYDTSSDPVVRSAACELRKRIAQYYHEQSHSDELRIELPIGSYVPIFQPSPPEPSATFPVSEDPFQSGLRVPRLRLAYPVLACVAVVLVAVSVWSREARPSSLNRFWSEVASTKTPVLLCVGTRDGKPASVDGSDSQLEPPIRADFRDLLPITDAMAFARIAAFLQEQQKAYRIQSANATTISDLTQGPAVVLGAFDNPWALRITQPLRFHFVETGEDVHYIADRQSPSNRYIEIQSGTPGRDFAIIARIFNNTTGQISVVAAGLGAAGTTAASEFVTSRNDMNLLLQRIPKNSSSRNIEAVVSVPVIDDSPGAPRIIAVDVW